MNHLIRYKWFWLTLGGWCFFTSLCAWGSIFSLSNPSSSSPISRFVSKINNKSEENQFYLERQPLEQTLSTITDNWEAEGWENISGQINLASVFLNFPEGRGEFLSSIVQIRLFQNRSGYKILALMRDLKIGKTYQWVSEMPKSSLEKPDLTLNDFPIHPPPEAKNVSLINTRNTESLSWSVPQSADFSGKFRSRCLSLGFTEKRDSPAAPPGELFFVLQRRSALIMTSLLELDGEFTISMVKVAIN